MIYENIPPDKRDIFLKELLEYVVDKNGLASIPKADMEACFVYLYKKHVCPNCDIYTLSKIFKIKEIKLKNLMELFLLKFDDAYSINEEDVVLDAFLVSKYQIESIEKVEINFHFSKIEYVPIIQNYFRKINGSIKYDTRSESVIVNQNRLYDVLDYIWNNHKDKEVVEGNPKHKVQSIIGLLGNSIDEELRKKLREQKKSKLYQTLDYASKLTGIGSLVLNLYKSDAFKILIENINS